MKHARLNLPVARRKRSFPAGAGNRCFRSPSPKPSPHGEGFPAPRVSENRRGGMRRRVNRKGEASAGDSLSPGERAGVRADVAHLFSPVPEHRSFVGQAMGFGKAPAKSPQNPRNIGHSAARRAQPASRLAKEDLRQSRPAFRHACPDSGIACPDSGRSCPAFGRTRPAFRRTCPAFRRTCPAFRQARPAFGLARPDSGIARPATTPRRPGGGNYPPHFSFLKQSSKEGR